MNRVTINFLKAPFAACACVLFLIFLHPAELSAQKTSSLKKSKPAAEAELSADDLDLTAEMDADTHEPVFKSQPKKTAEKKTPEKKTTAPAKKTKAKSPISDNEKGGIFVETPDFAAQAAKAAKTSKTAKKKKKPGEEEEPEDTRTPEERELDRIRHFRETGIWLWPEITEEELVKIDAEQREYLESVKRAFPTIRLHYYETTHFFFLTDAPQPIAVECVHYLEAMYVKLCELFAIPAEKQVWRGKCTVIAFAAQQHFVEFEVKFYQNTAVRPTTTGLAHQRSDGEVKISMYFGDVTRMEKRWQFMGTMVHECTHGFCHRYKSRQNLPTWLEEGLCEFVAMSVVTKDTQVRRKQDAGLRQIRTLPSVGGMLTSAGPLDAWQYGVASGIVHFLLTKKTKGVGQLLDLIKDGTPWEEALKEAYNCTPEEMLVAFGRQLRPPIPMLRP